MQKIRNATWRLVALAFFYLFGTAVWPLVTNGPASFQHLPDTSHISLIAAILIGIVVPTRILKIPSTLNHEIGHALMASLLRESVMVIRVEHDTSGVTYSYGKMSRIHSGLRSAAGPLASATLLLFTTLLIVEDRAHLWILFTLLSTILITLTTVRSIWGWVAATIVVAALSRALQMSIQIGSATPDSMKFGIWFNSTWNIPILLAAFSTGVGLRYSWRCRKPFSEGQDEAKFGRALGMGPKIGGHLILLINLALTWAATSVVFGWPHLWTPTFN